MNLSSPLFTIIEVLLVSFAVWAVFNENKFIAFEERIAAHFRRRRFKVIKGNNICKSCYPEKYRA